jgi:hypothetical protein
MEPRARALLEGLVAIAPEARVTLLGKTPFAGQLSSLIERASAENEALWLRERRFLYDTVLLLDPADAARLQTALVETQPQALLVADVSAADSPCASLTTLQLVDVVLCESPDDLRRVRDAVPDKPSFVVATDAGVRNESRDALRKAMAATGAAVAG